MSTSLRESLEYHLLPGKPLWSYQPTALHDQAYAFWKKFWSDIYRSNGTDKKPNCDDFLRQDRIALFTHAGKIVAMHAYTFFDLAHPATREHSYFSRYYTPGFLKALEEKRSRRLMTFEYFAVAPEWRAPKLGISLAAVMGNIGLRLAQEHGIDVVISALRSDIGVDKLARDSGAVSLESNVQIYNTPCELMAWFADKIGPHHDKAIADLVEYFWQRRHDSTQPSTNPTLKIAA